MTRPAKWLTGCCRHFLHRSARDRRSWGLSKALPRAWLRLPSFSRATWRTRSRGASLWWSGHSILRSLCERSTWDGSRCDGGGVGRGVGAWLGVWIDSGDGFGGRDCRAAAGAGGDWTLRHAWSVCLGGDSWGAVRAGCVGGNSRGAAKSGGTGVSARVGQARFGIEFSVDPSTSLRAGSRGRPSLRERILVAPSITSRLLLRVGGGDIVFFGKFERYVSGFAGGKYWHSGFAGSAAGAGLQYYVYVAVVAGGQVQRPVLAVGHCGQRIFCFRHRLFCFRGCAF